MISGTAAAALLWAGAASAYPGGTPSFQTDVAPYCAACHSSRSVEALAGAGERAEKELVERKHIAVILSGQKGYESLAESDRTLLAEQIRALDAASTVQLEAPDRVRAGHEFVVTVRVTGGAGPALGIGLVDSDHRWFARPAASSGWSVAAPPQVSAGGAPQQVWLSRRPASADRNVSFVNVTDVASDAAAGKWARASVRFHLRAPDRAGSYPLAAVFLYGTEKASVLGYTTDALGRKQVRGGYAGSSGRVLFTPVKTITVGEPGSVRPAAN
jgi:hypothetical protein